MNTHIPFESRWLTLAASLTLVVGLSACAGMSRQDQNTAIGAGVGAVGGAVLTDGSAPIMPNASSVRPDPTKPAKPRPMNKRWLVERAWNRSRKESTTPDGVFKLAAPEPPIDRTTASRSGERVLGASN